MKNRLTSKLNPFWTKVRNTSLVFVAFTGVILTAPLSLPATIITGATYVGTIAAALVAAAQATKDNE